jgi:hypothetical protein
MKNVDPNNMSLMATEPLVLIAFTGLVANVQHWTSEQNHMSSLRKKMYKNNEPNVT